MLFYTRVREICLLGKQFEVGFGKNDSSNLLESKVSSHDHKITKTSNPDHKMSRNLEPQSQKLVTLEQGLGNNCVGELL